MVLKYSTRSLTLDLAKPYKLPQNYYMFMSIQDRWFNSNTGKQSRIDVKPYLRSENNPKLMLGGVSSDAKWVRSVLLQKVETSLHHPGNLKRTRKRSSNRDPRSNTLHKWTRTSRTAEVCLKTLKKHFEHCGEVLCSWKRKYYLSRYSECKSRIGRAL